MTIVPLLWVTDYSYLYCFRQVSKLVNVHKKTMLLSPKRICPKQTEQA
jgi:hypothetical protein